MKRYIPIAISIVVALLAVALLATRGDKSQVADAPDDGDGAFRPARVIESDEEDATARADTSAAKREAGAIADTKKPGAETPGADTALGDKGTNDPTPRRPLFSGRPGEKPADVDGEQERPARTPPRPENKEIVDAFQKETSATTMKCIQGFVSRGKSFQGDVVLRVAVVHDASRDTFEYKMNTIELDGSARGALSDFDSETYDCLWNGIESFTVPETPRVEEAFRGDDTLSIEVPYSIEVKGEGVE